MHPSSSLRLSPTFAGYWVWIVGVLAGACAPPTQTAAPSSMVTGLSPAQALREFSQVLAAWQFPHIVLDPKGFLSTDDLALAPEDRLEGKPSRYWADCGKKVGVSRALIADSVTIQLSVVVRAHQHPDSSYVEVTPTITAYDQWMVVRCLSRGRLEPTLLQAITSKRPT